MEILQFIAGSEESPVSSACIYGASSSKHSSTESNPDFAPNTEKCGVSLIPVEAERLGGSCPVCGKKLTMGVDHRVEQLADRAEGFVKKDGKKYESLVPLPEVISTCMGYSTASKKVQGCFEQMIQTLGTEFDILRNVPSEDIKSCAGERIAEGIENVRTGNVKRIPGYDGEYGKIELFDEN